ncbi:hypothetical protein GCM10027451_34400 [Geodermatophilus aquaeductus]|uniref:Uncharacterized protein n=1 Tax=Geodermatophilus aquaeductus TaxID=1564161 RepID=A0A521CVE2_9ACTN|nr:hypothetical protein [Geodermatophilus aquaeductus]SMO63395.1 hypothetical protein SAMN06273567_102708 [Geodermatophilus aquaeductus]
MGTVVGWVVSGLVTWTVAVWQRTAEVHRRFFTPADRFGVRDPQLERLTALRGAWGIAILTVAQLQWAGLGGLGDQLDRVVLSVLRSAAIGGVAMLVPMALILLRTPSQLRRQQAANLRVPLGRLGGSVAGIVLAAALAWLVLDRVSPNGIVAFLVLALAWTAVVAVGATLWVAGRLVVVHWFCAVDGHPALRGLTELAVAAVVLVLGVAGLSDPENAALPPVVAVAFAVVGPLLSGALATVELRRLRARGIGLGTVLPAVPAPS